MALNKSRFAAEALGLGSKRGALEKLTIFYEEKQAGVWHNTDKIEALFNPNAFEIGREIEWEAEEAPVVGPNTIYSEQDFRSVHPAELQISLFFDTYEEHSDKLSLKHLKAAVMPGNALLSSPDATNVKQYTDAIAGLGQIKQELHRPPVCKLKWGEFELFKGVLTQLTQKFTLFMPNGMPVRATVNCTFHEYETFTEFSKLEPLSADVYKRYTVRRHDTLHSIAAEMFNDPRLWRHIARANKIVNPRRELTVGTVLLIPSIKPEA